MQICTTRRRTTSFLDSDVSLRKKDNNNAVDSTTKNQRTKKNADKVFVSGL